MATAEGALPFATQNAGGFAQAADGRKYRSKKQRPCDLCRSRKTHCRLPSNGTACELCSKLSRSCTFLREPKKRTQAPSAHRRRASGSDPSFNGTFSGNQARSTDADSIREGQSQHGNQRSLQAEGAVPIIIDAATTRATSIPGHGMALAEENLHNAPFWTPGIDLFSSEMASLHVPTGISPRLDSAYYAFDASMSDSYGPFTGLSPGLQRRSSNLNQGALSPSASAARASEANVEVDRSSPALMHRSSPASDWPSGYTLDRRANYSHQLIGNSCESDPYLLRNYRYDDFDTYHMFRLDFRNIQDDSSLRPFLQPSRPGETRPPGDAQPVQFVLTSEDIWKDSYDFVTKVQAGPNNEADDLALINKLIPQAMGSRLLQLYRSHIHPQFPILSLSDLAAMPYRELTQARPVGVQAAVYALAMPFSFLDDELSILRGYDQPPSVELWTIAHRSYQRAASYSHLSCLQLCLLLLEMPPLNPAVAEPLSTWAMSCSAVSIAENLGLNLDPSNWRLPSAEVALRRRLWWFTYAQHVAYAVVIARPSHIHDRNWDVTQLSPKDFELEDISDAEVRSMVERHIPLCIAYCDLITISADVLDEFYTLRAVRKQNSLSELLERAQPLRARILAWRNSLSLLSKSIYDLDEQEFDDGISLRFSHLTLEILISRALLRPLFSQAVSINSAQQEPVMTIFENAFACAKVAMDIVASMKAKHFTQFWHPYSRYQLCYISTLILMSLTQAPTADGAMRSKALLKQWRDTLRAQSRAWPLARLATIRLDAALWKGLSYIVHGSGEDSHANLLLRELVSDDQSSPSAPAPVAA